MAIGVNNITILGNITRDPELRFTPNGIAVVGFGLAVNRSILDKKSGEWQDEVDFFNVTAWFKLAENCAESLTKGDRVLVSGRLSQDRWEDKEGQKRSVVKITASIIAPSLEFASCKLEKNPKTGNSGVSAPTGKGEAVDFTDEDIPY